jgi:hypothetical protein|tara:strand:- start:5732 stop:6373 length:642 start_codon:yes stop_codon:yes gene_type:complete
MQSFRRKYLDKFLIKNTKYMHGNVLDVGGKKINRRGQFNPSRTKVVSWKYLNTDNSTQPDYIASVYDMPINNKAIQTVVFCEILEYLEEPDKALKEIRRILTVNGHIIGSIPFLSPVHGDKKYDQIRYTKQGLSNLFKSNEFEIIELYEMGSTSAVIFDILRVNFGYSKKVSAKLFIRLLFILRPLFLLFEILNDQSNEHINTGYFFVLKKID